MYFPFLELRGCGKRFAVRLQAIYSEVPKIRFLPSSPLSPLSGLVFYSGGWIRQRGRRKWDKIISLFCIFYCIFCIFRYNIRIKFREGRI